MNNFYDIIEKRIKNPNIEEFKDQRNEIREIAQELILSGLAKTDFFNNAVFMGGTALRLIHGLNRYSEDLDFRFLNDNKNFKWSKYYEILKDYIKLYNGNLLYLDESNNSLSRAKFINDKLIENIHKKKIIGIEVAKNKYGDYENIEIQLDISYKEAKSNNEIWKSNFPEDYKINVYDIHSLCSGKIKAILTRRDKYGNEINEGRDWYDLNWLIKKGVEPNFDFLYKSLKEDKKYKDNNKLFDEQFIKNELFNRARNLNYEEMNYKISAFTTKKNRLTLTNNNIKETINDLGKNGYLIKNNRKI